MQRLRSISYYLFHNLFIVDNEIKDNGKNKELQTLQRRSYSVFDQFAFIMQLFRGVWV
jgi:hypothetical protein